MFDFAPKWQGHLNLQGADGIGANNAIVDNLYSSRFSSNRGVFNGSGDLLYFSKRMTGMAALGINKTSGFHAQAAPRVGVALPVANSTIIKASWGQAYKVPSLYALENPNVGNPSLLPEKVTGIDVGVQHRFGSRLVLSGTYYSNLFSNLIDFSATAFRLVNRTRVRTEGLETEASLSVARGIEARAWGSYPEDGGQLVGHVVSKRLGA